MQLKLLQTCNVDFKVKALEDGSVYLEGWANKAVVDRGKDLIGKKAWNVENYKKNPIMLFNHDHSKPIGKMLSVEAKDEGLYIKGRISNSKDPEISRIRDLVKEGILNSLSVGIMVSDEEQKDGVNVIKSVELHECSVVAVPMNQDSQFTVSAKSMKGSLLDTLELITGAVGFKDVEKCCHILHLENVVYNSVDEIAGKLADECKIPIEETKQFIRMKLKETPPQIKEWLLKECMPPEEEMKAEDPMAGKAVMTVIVPKASFASMEELQTWATDSGWKVDAITEEGDNYLLGQNSADAFEGEMSTIDMGDGVSAVVGVLKAVEPPPEETDPPAVEVEVEVEVPEDEPAMKGLLDDENPLSQPITGNTAANIEVNPTMDQARQTNVLLANVVMLLQQLLEKMDTVSKPDLMSTTEVVPVEPEITPMKSYEDPEDALEEQNMIKTMEDFILKTGQRLSQLGL